MLQNEQSSNHQEISENMEISEKKSRVLKFLKS